MATCKNKEQKDYACMGDGLVYLGEVGNSGVSVHGNTACSWVHHACHHF
jgi:3-deoxy-D-manno-octulosonate 8-phosphate phosphatase KdsC-like HAD superfamily phosphatase